MAELDRILSQYVNHDKDPVGGLQGAAFVVMDRDGKQKVPRTSSILSNLAVGN